jgi:hypothetical protein
MFRSLYILLVTACTTGSLSAQITFTDCTDKTLCLGTNCAALNTTLTTVATTTCGFVLNFTYTIDLGNDGIINSSGSGASVNVNLPPGQNKITWRAADGCGNTRTCAQVITVNDCTPPNLICIPGLNQSLSNDCTLTFQAATFVSSMTDNCTPTNQIEVGVRREGTGTGFPTATSITFNNCDEGLRFIEIWIRDQAGLTSQCALFVNVQDNLNLCTCISESVVNLQGCVTTSLNRKMNSFQVRSTVHTIPPDTNTAPVQVRFRSQNYTDSCFTLAMNSLPLNGDYRVRVSPFRFDLPTTGFTTFDLLLISRHILSFEPFTTFYQMMAADINNSRTVTSFDIVEGRKVILGVLDTFPNKPVWQFTKPVPNPSNMISWDDVSSTYTFDYMDLFGATNANNINWVGVKTGDINRTSSFSAEADDRWPDLPVKVEDRPIGVLEEVSIPFVGVEPVTLSGWQMAIGLDPEQVEFVGVEGLPDGTWLFNPDDYTLRIAWLETDAGGPIDLTNQTNLFTLRVRIRQVGLVSQWLRFMPELVTPEATLQTTERRKIELMWQHWSEDDGIVEILTPRPNPFREEVRMGVWCYTPTAIAMDIFDATGRLVIQRQWDAPVGYQHLILPGHEFPQAGVYTYRVQVGSQVSYGRLVRH